jgi:hypothetical protein
MNGRAMILEDTPDGEAVHAVKIIELPYRGFETLEGFAAWLEKEFPA